MPAYLFGCHQARLWLQLHQHCPSRSLLVSVSLTRGQFSALSVLGSPEHSPQVTPAPSWRTWDAVSTPYSVTSPGSWL